MTRTEYMNRIKTCLKRLPKQDLEQALDYFNEYFDEAGPEQETKAIEDLGEPKAAAEQILRNLAITNAGETEKKNIKRSMDSVWIGILAVCAAPIALPLMLAFVVVIFSLAISVLAVIGSLLLTGALTAVLSLVPLFGGCYLLFTYPAGGIVTLGVGLLFLGGGLLTGMACIAAGKLFLNGMTKLLGLCVKGGRSHDKN